jgi:hypothetical protein
MQDVSPIDGGSSKVSIFPILDWHYNTSSYTMSDTLLHIGRIPLLLNPDSPDPVWQQVQDNYLGGWQPVLGDERKKWTLTADDYLIYPGLPAIAPAAMAWLRSERILVYPAGWVVVAELNGDFTVARIMP